MTIKIYSLIIYFQQKENLHITGDTGNWIIVKCVAFTRHADSQTLIWDKKNNTIKGNYLQGNYVVNIS